MAVSPERICVEWARAVPLAATRVATKLPANPTLPFLQLFLVGGGPDDIEYASATWSMQFNCYGSTDLEADTLMIATIDATRNGSQNQALNEGKMYRLAVAGGRPGHDPDNPDRSLYVLDVFLFSQ